ncbi:MAG: hypothetical protein ACFFAO_13585 [Candidatus Hermodarchaeota archaeon]
MHNDIKLNINEKSLVNLAQTIMKKKNIDHFYASYLMKDNEFDVKKVETILRLIEKKVIRPIE